MEIDELKEKAAKIFKTPNEKIHFQDKNIDALLLNYDIETIYETINIFREKNPKKNWYTFFQDYKKHFDANTRTKIYSKYQNKDVEYIIESLLDSMEYYLQKAVLKNKNYPTRFNRNNYIPVGKTMALQMSSCWKSFTINEFSEIEIISEHQTEFINQIEQILKGWFDMMKSPELKSYVKNVTIKEIIRIYLINYFWNDINWKKHILEPLSLDFENDIIIKTKNDMARSLQTVREQMLKAGGGDILRPSVKVI